MTSLEIKGMSHHPLVSVVIPAKNSATTIEKAVASVLCQKGVGWIEVILVDDGSTDGTPELVAEQFPDVKVLFAGGGVSAARNLGIAASNGKFVAFLDSDDEWYAGKLYEQVTFLEENSEYVLCASVAHYVDAHGRDLGTGKKGFDGYGTIALLKGNFIVASSVVMDRKALQPGVGFDEQMTFGEDWLMWIRLSARGKIKVYTRPMVNYTRYSGRKYELDRLEHSLQRMVESIYNDPIVYATLRSKWDLVAMIPSLARITWMKEVRGRRAAISELTRLSMWRPRVLCHALRRLL